MSNLYKFIIFWQERERCIYAPANDHQQAMWAVKHDYPGCDIRGFVLVCSGVPDV